jgi:CRISPR-associated protein Cmr2
MTYLALTIGPIYKTLQNAKKTRELWGSSYIFSYIMKSIISEFHDRVFITPYTADKTIFEPHKEVGLFHDRFIFEAKQGDKKRLEDTIDAVLSKLSQDTKMSLDFIKSYFQINHIQVELLDAQNPILEINPYLDTIEQFYEISRYQTNELSKMLKGNNSFLTKEAFGQKRRFPTLAHIAMSDLADRFDIKELLDSDDEDAYENPQVKKYIKPYHKYIAIVQADGDSMTKLFADKSNIQSTSQKLFDFCQKSHEMIVDFGGQTIFAGGDDLLFFAPVVNNGKTLFELIDNLSRLFDGALGGKATISFGVSITYYKFPLYEALEKCRNLLFERAKKEPKNNIAFEVVKHSGQAFGGVVHKGFDDTYSGFLSFVSIEKSLDDNFLHSLHHKIDLHKKTLEQIKNSEPKLQNFFANYFNEAKHDDYRDFFQKLISYIKAERDISAVYATLRFVKFIKGDKA